MRVGVVGGAGRMGREVCAAVAEAPDLQLAAVVDTAFDGGDHAHRLIEEISSGAGHDVVAGETCDALVKAGVEVVVDFTVADAARVTLPWCASQGIHAVIGTTGLGPDDMAALADSFTGAPANAVVAPNFAIGAVLLIRFCELAAPHMEGAEVIELHHDKKRDAPSGTAVRTAERIAAARAAAGAEPWPPDATRDVVVEGARGGAADGGVRLHAVRLPGLVAHEEVVFGALGQALTIRHDSFDRRSFMPGVLLAVREVPRRPGLTVGLESLLGL
ncbi:MAG: 4-hydroxy-tetrahydrodipicolinate reductase [Acidimicrobiales bacterium]